MNVKSVTLVLENCEEVTFKYPSEIYMLETGDIKERYVSYCNTIGKQKYVDGFSVVFGKDCGELGSFSPDENDLPLKRLNQYKDVTGLYIEYDNEEEDFVGVSWDGVDSETVHSGQGLVLTEEGNVLYYSETGNYQCKLKQEPESVDMWAYMVKDQGEKL